MKIKAKFILAFAVSVAFLQVLIGLNGLPAGVDASLGTTYHINVLFGRIFGMAGFSLLLIGFVTFFAAVAFSRD